MSFIFSCCSSFQELNIYNIYTNNVTDMRYMFHKCSSWKEINLSNFNTNNITDMSYMFSGCSLNFSLVCDNDLIKKKMKKMCYN